jgi:regulator of cell morphogenesis and NO signaling
MTAFDPSTTVGELVREKPARSRVFESLGIDYCCGGKIPLADACGKKGLDLGDVCRQLADCGAEAADRDDLVDADKMSLTELCDHIENTHHAFLKTEIPRLDAMTSKVAKVHGGKEPRLTRIRAAFEAFRDEVQPHMMKEERVLFPLIRAMDDHATNKPGEPLPQFHCLTIENPIRQMVLEHEHAGNELAIMRAQSDNFSPPDWACNTYRAMLDALHGLEGNMHQHVHKENNVLFIKAAEMEERLRNNVVST